MDKSVPKSIVLQRIWKRVNLRNQNAVIGVFGPTGSGKSYTALRVCSSLDAGFNIARVVFSAKEFLHLLNSGTLKRGSCILWDESGVNLGSRDWQSANNKAVFSVLQTFRSSNLILVFCTPDYKFMDSGARRLFHLILETKFIDRIKSQVVLKPFLVEHGIRNGKEYFKYPRRYLEDGMPVMIDSLRVGLPRKELIDAYEAKKSAFLKELNTRLEAQLIAAEAPKAKRGMDFESIAKQIADSPNDYLGMYRNKPILKWNLIAARFNVGKNYALRIKALAEAGLEKQKVGT